MSDNQRISGLGGIKPSRMPSSTTPDITVREAEKRLGIAMDQATETLTADLPARQPAGSDDSHTAVMHAGMPAVLPDSLPDSLRNRKPRQITVSKTFRLPLNVVEELEQVSALHDIPMVTILSEALEIHLARFPR